MFSNKNLKTEYETLIKQISLTIFFFLQDSFIMHEESEILLPVQGHKTSIEKAKKQNPGLLNLMLFISNTLVFSSHI